MSKTEDHSSYRKETIIQISEARASENRAQEAPTMLRKDVNLEELGLSEAAIRSSRNPQARASRTWWGQSTEAWGTRKRNQASRGEKGMMMRFPHSNVDMQMNGQVFLGKEGDELPEGQEKGVNLEQGIKRILEKKYGRLSESYRVRKAINRIGKQALERMDRSLHFVGTNGSMLVPRKQECGHLRMQEGVGQLSTNPLRTGLTQEVRSIAPPILLEKEGSLLEREKELVQKVYLHPIIFPPGSPEQIVRYYRRLYQIANINHLPHQSLFIDHQGEPCINRKEFQIKIDNLKQKWLGCFVRDFIEKRIPEITCPDTLAYWEWFFGTFEFEKDLGIVAFPDSEKERFKLTWAHCTHLLRDQIFYLEITRWTEAQLSNFEPEFYNFYCELKNKPQLIGPPIQRPQNFA